MSNLKGEFYKTLNKNQLPIASFRLINTSWFGSDTIRVTPIDERTGKYLSYDITIKSGGAVILNRDTIEWDWAQGDKLYVDMDGKRYNWECKFPEYPNGSCPQCHGKGKCPSCHGEGYSFGHNYSLVSCPTCGATGSCLTCYVPYRGNSMGIINNSTSGSIQPSNSTNSYSQVQKRTRSISQIQSDIRRNEHTLNQIRGELLRKEFGQDYGVYYQTMSHNAIELEYRIRDLYEELNRATLNGNY